MVKEKVDFFRVVSTKEGRKLGEKLGMPFYEISSKRHSGHVISRIFFKCRTKGKLIVSHRDCF